MEYSAMETDSVTSGIKRRVKDIRISKTKLNVSLASKIKTKIINNSSIFKISLKHNNRALAQALSREKENSRRITTEKMLLQKEVEKLNFENTFLRLKLNNLNKKLIEIESLMNNNLITAIEMSTLSEFHQSSFLLPASKKKQISKQSKLKCLPFARVPLTANDDGDDDDNDKDKEKTHCDNNIISETPPDVPFSVSRQPLSPQCNSDVLFLKEDNQKVHGLDDSEHISSIVDVLPKENHYHSDQSFKSSLMSEMRNVSSISHRRENLSLSNVTERKKRGSSWESNNPIADIPNLTDLDHQQLSSPGLNWNNEINDCTNEKNIEMQINKQHLPNLSSESASEPNAECMNQVRDNDDFQVQKTVGEDTDMDLTASEVSKTVTVSRGSKNKRNKKTNCGMETFRKVKDPSSGKKREKSTRKCKKSSGVDIEENIKNIPDLESVALDGKRNSENPNFTFSTEHLTQSNILKEITLQNGFDQDDSQNTQYNEKNKIIHVSFEQEKTYSFSQSSDKLLKESKFDIDQNSLTYNKSKTSRQTFVIHKPEEDNLFQNKKDKSTISENLEVTNEFQTADLSSKENGNLCDHETQNMLDLKKYVTNIQSAQQKESKVNKLRPKVNRKTEIISEMNQIYEDNDKVLHCPEKDNIFSQTQVNKESISGNSEVSKEFQIPILFTRDNGNICDSETQNVLGLQKQITDVYPLQQNESKINKTRRQKVNRKTEIISEVNHFENDKNMHCSEKSNSFFPEKDREIIPAKLKDSSEFQTPALYTKDSRELYGKTQNGMQPACQNESKTDKKLRPKINRKTEIISEINQIHESDDKDIHDLEKGHLVSLTQKDKKNISENLEVPNGFQAVKLPTKDNGNLCDHEIQSILDLKKHVTNLHLTQQSESNINKRLRQKVNRKTEIISETNQICEDIDKDVDGQNAYTKDLDFKINKSEPKFECQDIINEYYMKTNSNEKENCDQVPNPYKLVKKRGKKSSGKAKNILTKDKNKPIPHLIDSSQTSVSLESGLKHITNEANSDPGNQIQLPENQKQSPPMSNTNRDLPFVGVEKEEKYLLKKVNKMESKSKKRKTLRDPSLDTLEVIEIISDTDHRKSVDSEQADKENYLENEKIVKTKPDFCTKVFKPLSQIYSPNIQNSSLDNIHQSSIPLNISSSKNLLEENFALESSPIIHVSGDLHEKIKNMKFKVHQRAQESVMGNRTSQYLTNTSFVSNNTAKSENESEDLSSELQSRKRKCAPLDLKEPNLKRKMRR